MTISAHRYQATWNGVTFNSHYDNTGAVDDPAHVTIATMDKTTLEALQDVQIQVSDYRELRQYLEGVDPNEAFEGARLLRLSGRLYGTTWGKLEDRKLAMDAAFSVAACRFAFAGNTPKGLAPLNFRIARDAAPGYADRCYFCRPATARPMVIARQGQGLVVPYLGELVAFDPRMFSQSEQNLSMTLLGGGNVVANSGTIYTSPRFVIVLSGAGSNPATLTNSTTGQVMTFNFSGLAAGTYTLDTWGRGSFTKADGSNVYSTRLSGWITQMFLAPGNNTLTWTGNTALTSVTVYWRSAWA